MTRSMSVSRIYRSSQYIATFCKKRVNPSEGGIVWSPYSQWYPTETKTKTKTKTKTNPNPNPNPNVRLPPSSPSMFSLAHMKSSKSPLLCSSLHTLDPYPYCSFSTTTLETPQQQPQQAQPQAQPQAPQEYLESQGKQTNHSNNPNRIKTFEVERGILHVQLARPSKLNSLDLAMFEAIAYTASQIRDDRSLRVVILSGIGKAFCTGLDISSFLPMKKPNTKRDSDNDKNVGEDNGDSSSSSSSSSSSVFAFIGNPLKHMKRLLERPSGYERTQTQSQFNVKQNKSKNALGNLAQDVAYLWRDLDIPVIAVLHGMCFGGGMYILFYVCNVFFMIICIALKRISK